VWHFCNQAVRAQQVQQPGDSGGAPAPGSKIAGRRVLQLAVDIRVAQAVKAAFAAETPRKRRDFTAAGEALHAECFRLLDYSLALREFPDETEERCNVHLDGPDLGEQFARPNLWWPACEGWSGKSLMSKVRDPCLEQRRKT
jgi:hypothetical protein